jgi:hypothetical protein
VPEERRLETQTTRRTVVKTVVKLIHATPLVAASFPLLGQSVLAANCSCKHCSDLGAAAPY